VLSYDANDVFLTLSRNATFFQNLAQTSNQRSVGGALDASPLGSAIVQSVLFETAAGARQAYDALSGEVHGSVQSELLDDSLYVRQAILGRLRQAGFTHAPDVMAALGFAGPVTLEGSGESAALGYASASGFPAKAPPRAAPAFGSDVAFWSQGVAATGHIDGDGNAASTRRDLAGVFTGFDARFGEFARIGIAGGYSHSSLSVNARASAAGIDTAHLGAYAGATFGALNLRGGAAYAFHTIDTSRTIAFPGFIDSARARYEGGTGQIFGEIGYGVALGRIAAEPFVGLAWVHLRTDGFAETGGVAALNGSGSKDDVGYSTLGARLATSYLLPNGMALIPRVSVSWQHAFNDIAPTAALAFQNTGAGFAITGVPLARDAALVETGLDLRVSPQAKLSVSYSGQLAGHLQDHAVKGNFTWNFQSL
jgi:outer membrane autotransporter protein